MKYRAVADGLVKDGHPVQILGHDYWNVKDWAKRTANAEHCDVRIYETIEKHKETVKPTQPGPPEEHNG